MSELRQQMLTDLRMRNYAERTQGIYITRVAEMARHLKRSPDTLTTEDVHGYLRHLKEERGVSRSAFVRVPYPVLCVLSVFCISLVFCASPFLSCVSFVFCVL